MSAQSADVEIPTPPMPRRTSNVFRVVPSPFGAFAGLLVLVVLGLVVYPLGKMLVDVFVRDGSISVSAFTETLQDAEVREAFFTTLVLAIAATTAAIVIASFLAWVNERTDAGLGAFSEIVPLLPLVIPGIASSVGYVVLFAPRAGYVNVWIRDAVGVIGIHLNEGPFDIFSMWGLFAVYTVLIVPFAYLPIAAALRNLDPALEEASLSSGASLLTTTRRITLPAVKPAIASAGLLGIVVCFALYAIPAIIAPTAGIEIFALQVFRSLQSFPPNTDVAIAMNFFVLLLVVLVSAVQRRISRGSHFAKIGGRGSRSTKMALGRLRWPIRVAVIAYLSVASLLPFIGLFILSIQRFWSQDIALWNGGTFDNYREVFFEDPRSRTALVRSIQLGLIGATVAVFVIAIVALSVQRRPAAIGRLIDGVMKLPATISHLVLASGFALAFGGGPFNLRGTTLILLVAYFVFFLPFGYVIVDSSAKQIGADMIEASAVSSASAGQTLRRIELPLLRAGMTAAWALLFVQMAGDVLGAAMLGGTNTVVIGSYVLQQWEAGSFTRVAALSVVITLVATVVIVLVQVAGRRTGRGQLSIGS
ncbi:MAG: ABC transporter permease [Ilumatobacteraceae bacterium]